MRSNSPSIKPRSTKQRQQQPHLLSSSSNFHLGIIFEKDANSRYTERARLYQDIISYALEDTSQIFLFNDIAKFVIQRHAEYHEYYSGSKAHVPMSARIANRRDTIQKCINDLQEITLIVKVGSTPALKNKIPTPKYIFTPSGKTVALFLERLDPKKKQDADEKIFQVLKLTYSQSDLAANKFHLKFIERLKVDGLLEEILDRVTEYLSSTHELEHILSVYGIVTFRAFSDPMIVRKVWRSYLATFNDIDTKTRQIILRYEKTRLEHNITSGSRFRTKEWEDLWINHIADDSKIVLGGLCEKCFKSSAVVVDYFDYLNGVLTSEKAIYSTNCPKCKSERTFYVLPGNDSRDLRRLHTLRFISDL